MEGGIVSEELQEVEEELEHKKGAEGGETDDVDVEIGEAQSKDKAKPRFGAQQIKVFTQVSRSSSQCTWLVV